MERILGDRERACDFDHLPFAYRQVAYHGIGCNPVPGKDFIEFVTDEPAGPPAPTPSRDGRVKDACILGNRKIGAERQFLEDATDSELLGKDDQVTLPRLSADNDLPAVCDKRARQDMHQRRFAGAVMANQPDALSNVNSKINPRKRADGAEVLFDAVQSNDIQGRPGSHTR